MASLWSQQVALAQAEVEATIQALPSRLRAVVQQLPVTFERQPSRALQEDGIEADTFGLFVGEAFPDEAGVSPVPAQIILFLENLWEFAQGDESVYRAEIRTTVLHELGHYLGLDETDLEQRGLE